MNDQRLQADALPVESLKRFRLTEKQSKKVTKRIQGWLRRDTWKLWEACDIAYGMIPFEPIRFLQTGEIDSDELFDFAIRSVNAGKLSVGNPSDSPNQWWVHPSDFGKWAASRADIIGTPRAAIFAKFFPAMLSPADGAASRRRILESDYSTLEFDRVCAVIEEFWLPYQAGKRTQPKEDEITQWLKDRYRLPKPITTRAAERIDAVARMDSAKTRGPKTTKR
jgi:hypothetical protein